MSRSPRILIIRLSSLGDILHTLPAFSDIRSTFPNAKIDWLVSEQCKFLLPAVRGIDTFHVLDTKALQRSWADRSAWSRICAGMRELRQQHYDISIDFQGLLKTALIGSLSGAGKRFGFCGELVREFPAHWFYHQTLDKPSVEVHVLELNRMLAALAGAERSRTVCEFEISEEDRHTVHAALKEKEIERFAVLNPGGGWYTKRWSPEKYGALALKIQNELGLQVVVTTGPGEEPLYHAIAAHCHEAPPLHLSISFLQLVPLLRKARIFVGGDTGPFHLACALEIPVVGIFGPTSPLRNGPWRKTDQAVAHTLPCSFCYGRTCDTNNECMEITVDEVFSAIMRRLETHG
jgi:lipopolysaccharide heptosyltransferase I